MKQVNIYEVISNLSELICLLETKKEDYIIIEKDGKPIAKLVLIYDTLTDNRIGKGKGKFNINTDFDKDNDVIVDMLS